MALPDEYVEEVQALLTSLAPETISSMQRDYARRLRVELGQLAGTVVRLGRELRVPTPSCDALYAVLEVRAQTLAGLGQA